MAMGTSIELTLAGVSLAYSKNFMGLDFGHLFQAGDLTRRRTSAIDYDYYKDHPAELAELEEAELTFVRPLSRVVSRLRVLGHTIELARVQYEAVVADALELTEGEEGADQGAGHLTFEEFCDLANMYPLTSLSTEYVDYDAAERDRMSQGRYAEHAALFDRLPWTDGQDLYWSESSYLSARVCILSAEAMLEVFALNPENHDAEVEWEFGPIVHAGWVGRGEFQAGARRRQKILVATEGASDSRVLRRGLDLLRPDVADFFSFIDGEERHHFWGTGNLVKFAEGLLRIDIQNQILFLLDNDAEGVDALRKIDALGLPSNMRAMRLPDLEAMSSFPALGPEGLSLCDINGRASAIECFLDLELPDYPPARVIWSNYKKDLDLWHGALEHKDSYIRHFADQDLEAMSSGHYDASKLEVLLDALVGEASRLGARHDVEAS
jgi:hypothetical protein